MSFLLTAVEKTFIVPFSNTAIHIKHQVIDNVSFLDHWLLKLSYCSSIVCFGQVVLKLNCGDDDSTI